MEKKDWELRRDTVHDELDIQEMSLDEEWKQQARYYLKYSETLAEAIQERDGKKRELDKERATLDEDIRGNWDTYGFPARPTEAAISNCILKQTAYEERLKVLDEGNYIVNVMRGVVYAFDQKKTALEWMSKLFLNNYYAEPNIPQRVREEVSTKEGTEGQFVKKDEIRRAKRS